MLPKPFTKRLSRCRAKWTCIFAFSAICSPTPQSLPMVSFVWSWTRSDTVTLCEDAPQNHLQNGLAIAKLSELVFSSFLPYAHQLLSHVLWTVLCNLGLVWIPPHSVKMLHKTVYGMGLSQVLLDLGRGCSIMYIPNLQEKHVYVRVYLLCRGRKERARDTTTPLQ